MFAIIFGFEVFYLNTPANFDAHRNILNLCLFYAELISNYIYEIDHSDCTLILSNLIYRECERCKKCMFEYILL